MTSLPAPNDLILVAFMPSPRELEIARLLGLLGGDGFGLGGG